MSLHLPKTKFYNKKNVADSVVALRVLGDYTHVEYPKNGVQTSHLHRTVFGLHDTFTVVWKTDARLLQLFVRIPASSN